MEHIYNGSTMTKEHKEKRGFFYIEELFVGSYDVTRAPKTLREKVDVEIMENIEMNIKCFFGSPANSKIVFKNYAHFKKILEEVGINLKQYLK
jgi:hypothetical protein